MSLVVDLANFIAANSSLVVDTDLFVGSEIVSTHPGSIIIREVPGSTENWSGLEGRTVQLLSLDTGYVNAETLINTVYDLLANKAGLASVSGIFYIEVLTMPGILERDERGNYIFVSNLLVRRA